MQYTPREPFGPPAEQNDSPVGIVALWRLLWRNKLWIAAPMLGLGLIAALLVLRSDDIYVADAQVLLTRGNLEIIEFDSAGGFDVTPGAIANALTILGSRSLALQVSDRLGLTDSPLIDPSAAGTEPNADAVTYSEAELRALALDWLADRVQVSVLPNTNVLVIRATTIDPEISAAVANAYADIYLDYQRNLGQAETERAAEALERRVAELRLRLEDEQKRLQEFSGGAQSVTAQSANILAVEASAIRSRVNNTQEALSDIDALLSELDGATGADVEALRELINDSETLEQIRSTALGRSISAENLTQDIEALRAAAESEAQRLGRLAEALSQSQSAITERLAEVNAYNVGLRQLEVELETTSQVYQAALARLKELSIQTGLRDAGAQILTRAEPPLNSSAQGRRRIVAIAIVLGMFLGIAAVLLREAANDRVRRASDLSDFTGGESVVIVPALTRRGIWGRRKSIDRRAAQSQVTPFFEGIRGLRQKLAFTSKTGKDGALVVGVCAALPNEGKSTVTDALARSLALIGKRVIVIDADMRSGALSVSLGVERDKPGLQDVIHASLDPEDAIVTLPDAGYDLLPGGQKLSNPADLLESSRFAELVTALRSRYDVILFDTPPVLIVPDAQRIAARLDRCVFVSAYDRTPKAAISDALAALRETGVDHPIVVLCDVPEALSRQYGVSRQDYALYVN